jgi:hypothetical protein
MLSTISGELVDHSCTGACYKFPPGWVHPDDTESKRDTPERESKEADVKTTRVSLAEKLKKEIPTMRLEPLQNQMMCNCIALPCGYPVYGCSCGQKDVVVEMRFVPYGTGVPINQYSWNNSGSLYFKCKFKFKTTYHPEIWVSGHHTQECLLKMGKTVEEVYEVAAEATVTEPVVTEPVVKVTMAEKLLPFLDYSTPVTGLGKGSGNRRRLKKRSNRSKRANNKVSNHHIDVRVSDPFPVSQSDSLFWDDVLDKDYIFYCDCGNEKTIRLKSVTQAFNSDFKCSTCGAVSGLANYIMDMYEVHYHDPQSEEDDLEIWDTWDTWSDYIYYSDETWSTFDPSDISNGWDPSEYPNTWDPWDTRSDYIY